MSTDLVATGVLSGEEQRLLNAQWRSLRRVATGVAVLSSPAVFIYLHKQERWAIGWSLLGALLAIAAFRGLLDLLFHRFIRWPSLFGIDSAQLREEDVVARRRVWFWRFWAKVAYFTFLIIVAVYVVRLLRYGIDDTSFLGTGGDAWHWFVHRLTRAPSYASYGLLFGFFFLFNFGILLGPMLLMGISQIRGFEPGDADWGVKLHDVRGQAEAKEEVRRVVNLWQSGEAFEQAGGRRERGLLFLGAPGTGKTMLAKAIATGFNSPIVTMPGSGFAQTFIGMDVIIVRFMARKAKKLARKWGGQCIVFIDEIDAVGMRRQSLGGAAGAMTPKPSSFHDVCFFGPNGALNQSEDLVLESRAWRERLFAERDTGVRPGFTRSFLPRILTQGGGAIPGMFGGGGQLALNQLLIVMDGIDNPPFLSRLITSLNNKVLDALYVVPRRLGRIPLRLPHSRPSGGQIYFIGATNVPMEMLDPALTRPGRMGRHVWFRDEARPARHLRPLPGQGLARRGPRHREAPRRALARNQRLFAGHDRTGLLDGADDRPPRRAPRLRLGGHRRSDDDRRVGNRDRHRVRSRGDAVRRHPRGGPRRRGARLPQGRGIDPPLDQAARRGTRPPPGAREGGALQLLALGGDGTADLGPRRDGR
ncbi:MAG: AAA family ATPase [Actinobacteria bacterium]|nr:MAG: AAA family ATPase [Actinomycetota bacterium]